jgi:hypothetical protein
MRCIDGAAHLAAQRIELADQMTFAEAADRRVARHERDPVAAQRHDRRAQAHPRRPERRLAASVTGAG